MHVKVDIFKTFKEKKAALRRDLQELEIHVYPKNRDIVLEINKQGHNLHREIDSVIKKMKANDDDTNSKHLANLKKREDVITRSIAVIK